MRKDIKWIVCQDKNSSKFLSFTLLKMRQLITPCTQLPLLTVQKLYKIYLVIMLLSFFHSLGKGIRALSLPFQAKNQNNEIIFLILAWTTQTRWNIL